MAARKLALWFLNRVAHKEWDHESMRSALQGSFLGFGGNDVVLGKRSDPNCDSGVLMYEKEDHDEYFIPIPVKCIGDPDALGIPQSIKDFYKQYYTPGSDLNWAEYWKDDEKKVFPNVRMVSPPGKGYYKILQEYTAQTGRRHIVIGYSQGGLVARYMAYLDEYVSTQGVLDGIITIESPNFGSPLGRPANADNVLQCLNLVLAGFGQIDEASFPITAAKLRSLPVAGPGLNIRFVLDLLDTPLKEFRAEGSTLKKQKPQVFDYLETARKWLSGLDNTGGDPVFQHDESAFIDLNIALLARPGSVLHAVNKNPLNRIKHAAIVGTDNQLDLFFQSAVKTYVETLPRLKQWIGNIVVSRQSISDALKKLAKTAGDAYKGVMIDQDDPTAPGDLNFPEIQARKKDFEAGVELSDPRYKLQGAPLPQRAHDFVIPSAYQLMEKQTPAFLGNWVNPDASHLSGADPNQAGQATQKYVIEILKQMK